MKPVAILSQWYKEELTPWDAEVFYPMWLRSLKKFAPGVPIVMIHNGGPTDPPFSEADGVELWPAEGLVENGRGTFGHYYNCWRSMQHGFNHLRQRYENIIFIGQNTIPGVEFLDECIERLKTADVLLTFSQYHYEGGAFTEHLAAHPERCRELWQRYYDGSELLERLVPRWCRELKLRMTEFPNFYREDDRAKTYLCHPSAQELLSFVKDKGIA